MFVAVACGIVYNPLLLPLAGRQGGTGYGGLGAIKTGVSIQYGTFCKTPKLVYLIRLCAWRKICATKEQRIESITHQLLIPLKRTFLLKVPNLNRTVKEKKP